jgi:hypothetical protein
MTKPLVAEQILRGRHVNQFFEPVWLAGSFEARFGSLSLIEEKTLKQLWPDAAGSMG